MKETIFRYAGSIRVRIISAFMAFLIFTLGYAGYFDFEGFEHGMTANALEITSVTKTGNYINKDFVSSTSHDGHSVVKNSATYQSTQHKLTYRYTGNVKTTKVSLYDYKTDAEINGGSITNTYTNYGSEPFKQLNDAISADSANSTTTTTTCQSSDNITIIFTSSTINDNVHVYLWDDSNPSKNNAWPGVAMDHDTVNGCWKYTYSLTDSNSGKYLSFTPTHLQFNNGTDTNKTADINAKLEKGYTYSFEDEVQLTSNSDNIGLIFNSNSNGWDVYIYLWNDSGDGGISYPGTSLKRYQAGSAGNYLNKVFFSSFVPTKCILSRNSSSGNKKLTGDADFKQNNSKITLQKGYTYVFTDPNPNNPNDNYVNITSSYSHVQSAESFTYTTTSFSSYKYNYPLYFGCFYRENQNATTYTEAMKPKGQTFGDNVLTAGGPYANFYWQANLGMKSTGDGTGDNNVDVRGHAAVQGLVDDKLTLDADPNTATPSGALRQNGVELPYFSSTFASSNPTLMKVYDKEDHKGIDFPFYEILADVNDVRNVGIVGNDTDTARFYQFCSDDVNLKFDTENQQFLEETNTRIRSNNTDGNVYRTGYFPFDNVNSYGVSNNLGFGTCFELKFKLNKDGTVDSLDKDGNKSTNPTKIHTMFEFLGDDDLWVFIDGKLVLDLGGTHDQTSGLIDFYDGKAYANKAMSIKETGNNPDNLGASVGIKEKNIKTLINGYNSTTNEYDTNTTHTMTIFYLERGMMDSNLMIRFNYKPESNFSKMKVQEITDFSGVNAGLQDLTKKAADNDVFSYHVENSGTASTTPQYTGIRYPTYDTFIRNYVNDQTNPTVDITMNDQLTGKELEYETESATDPDAVFLNINNWGSESDIYAAWVWKTGENGKLYIGTKLHNTSNIYKFRGFPDDVDKIIFLRLKSENAPYFGGNVGWPEGKILAQSGNLDINKGCLYRYKQSQSSIQLDSNATPPPLYLKYEAENDSIFKPQSGTSTPVSNTNYLWVDEFAKQSGADIDDITSGFTGRTDSNGNFCLMYGTAGTESSAEFENQFDRNSTMKVTQSGTLYSPTRSGTETFSSPSSRTVSEYYKTTVRAYDRVGAELTNHNSNSTGSGAGGSGGTESEYQLNYKTTANGMETDYKFNNSPSIRSDDTLTVMMTEEFENSPNTGNLTVTKDIEDPVGNTESNVTREFEYKLTLTKVFNISGVDVTNNGNNTGYEKIVTKKTSGTNTTDGNALTNSGETESTFTLKPGESLTIENIPTGTHYKIEEIGEKVSGTTIAYYEYNKVYKKTGSDWTNQNKTDGVIEGDIETDTTHEYKYANKRKVGSLTLSKSLVGQSNAKTEVGENTTFTLNVTLQADTGVNIKNYLGATPTFTYGTGTSVTSTAFDTNDNGKYTFTATIKPSQTIKLDNIPYGTTVSVEETQDSNHPVASYAYTDGGSNTYTNVIEHPSTVVTVTNTYRQITLTKTDSKDNSKKLQGAVYYLLRLKTGANTNDAQTEFEAADASYDTTTLTNCFDVVSGELTTEQNGTIVIKDSNVTNGLVPGDYYLFEQSAPSDYTRQNSFTNNKITINNTESGDAKYTINLNNVRKTGTLELEKAVATGSPNETFTFSVELDGSEADLDLNKYAIAGLSSASYNDTTHKMTGTVSVTSGGTNPTITNIPFGTTYTVDEQSKTDWVKVDTVYSDDNKKIDTEPGTNDKVTIINAKTAEMNPAYLMLYEHINEKIDAWGDPTFIFKIRDTDSNKTSIVALTVDDDDMLNDKVLSGSVTGKTFTNWKVEATDESESGVLKYQGEYHIDDKGRIKVAPGNYEITRIPVSRYKFVTSATTDQYDTEPSPYTQTENKDGSDNPLETVTITNLQSGKTIDVHYYDEVEYYDKFSHVDTKVNKFYKLDNSKKNTTVKGISISNIPSTSVTTSGTTGTVNVSAYKVFVDGTVDTTAISGSELTIEFDSSISGDFSYSNGTITIQNATTTHSKQVYTLTAKYDNNKFTTTFDIAIP